MVMVMIIRTLLTKLRGKTNSVFGFDMLAEFLIL